MLRLHLQLRRQHTYERLLELEPRLRGERPSLTAARQRLEELTGTAAAARMWNTAFASFRSPWWIFNRTLPSDGAQLARIGQYCKHHAGAEAAQLRTIPEDTAQAQCARYGRPLLLTEPSCVAAQGIRDLANELIAMNVSQQIKQSA